MLQRWFIRRVGVLILHLHIIQYVLQQDLIGAIIENCPLINEMKCILIRFSASCPALNLSYMYFLNQHQLSVTNSHKYLGIIVSSNLDKTNHYNYISGQAYTIFGLLRRTFSNCNSTHAKKLLPLFSSSQTYLLLLCLATPSYQGHHHT